jgi:hypothetical protein
MDRLRVPAMPMSSSQYTLWYLLFMVPRVPRVPRVSRYLGFQKEKGVRAHVTTCY